MKVVEEMLTVSAAKARGNPLPADYADKVMAGAKALILQDGYLAYVLEVPFVKELATWMTARGWSSRTRKLKYPDLSTKADLLSESTKGDYRVICEAKQYVLDYFGAPKKRRINKKGLSQQHLGIIPGKPTNNAVHDIIKKLPLADSTHVAFLLIRIESREICGDDEMAMFVQMASLDDGRWASFNAEMTHPSDDHYRFIFHLWTRAVTGKTKANDETGAK